jgi:hypothetical protein
MSLRTVLLVRITLLITLVLFLGCRPSLAAPGANCAAKQQALDAARARVKADQQSVLRLKAGVTTEDLEKWVEEADKERREVLKDTLVSSIGLTADGLIASTEVAKNAVQPMNIAGVYLPHGVGSLGPGQANLIIGRIQRLGGDSAETQAVIDGIRGLVPFKDKTETLEFAAKVNDTATDFKKSFDLGTNVGDISNADGHVKTTAVGLQLLSGLAGKGEISVDVGEALFAATEHLTDAYLISSIINNTLNPIQPQPLSDLRYEVQESQGTVKPSPYQSTGKDVTERQLDALKVLSRKLDQDVKLLNGAKARMGDCQDCPEQRSDGAKLEGTWSVTTHFEPPVCKPSGECLPPLEGDWVFAKEGRCVFTLQMPVAMENCPPPVEITATGPNTYSGKWPQNDGCLGGVIDIQIQGSSLHSKRLEIYDNAAFPGSDVSVGHKLSH